MAVEDGKGKAGSHNDISYNAQVKVQCLADNKIEYSRSIHNIHFYPCGER